MFERDPGVVARFQGYRLVLNPVGFQAVRDCLPTRWHPLLDEIVVDASAEQLVLDPWLTEIGRLGAMRFRTPPRQAAERLAPEVALPDIGDYVRWAMILPLNGSLEDLTAQDAVLSRMDGWHPELRALVEQADPDNSTLLSIRVVEPGERWTSGPVTLLGDAIHATSPTGGNGANTALRDADLLRRRLVEAEEGRRTLLSAVDDYERQMFEYGAEAVRTSLDRLPAFLDASTAGEAKG